MSTTQTTPPPTQTLTKVAVAQGDGIGPEIMSATLRILEAAGAPIDPEFIQIGEKTYLNGDASGIGEDAWETINKNKLILKAPITTPQGKGYKSLNVTLRKSLNLYANIRPCRSLTPFVPSLHPNMNVVVVRENEEDLYAGIEHRQTPEVLQCLKLITIPGSRKIVREAFEYARTNGRKKVTCMVKDNIMKLTDGAFHDMFKEIGAEYPDIEQEVQIIDIGAARLASNPLNYDVVVTLNLYGDIISDITAEIAGSVGLAGSANIGKNFAMFEAIHGSAPDIAGQNIANPSGLLNGAVMMLQHIGATDIAENITNAWLKTLEDGVHTADIFSENFSTEKVGTQEFADAVIARLGQRPSTFEPAKYAASSRREAQNEVVEESLPTPSKELMGVDVFLDHANKDAQKLGEALSSLEGAPLKLKMITNRGVKVFPNGNPETFCTDHWRCRFVSLDSNIQVSPPDYRPVHALEVIELQKTLTEHGFDVIKTENLYFFDGDRGFSLGQGE
ncbi:NADP-dependent isocitrate dehydrogenase [Cryomorphaceae bacterium]|nr:NADP-dependent isocitrate dehydrogenase [Cryomorphaceae bacterium]